MYVLLEYSFSSCLLSILFVDGELANHLRLSELEPAGTGEGPECRPEMHPGGPTVLFAFFLFQTSASSSEKCRWWNWWFPMVLPTSLLKEVRLLHVEEGNWQVGFYSSLIRAWDPTSKVNLLSSPTWHRPVRLCMLEPERVRTQWLLTLQRHWLQPARLLCPWDSPGKNTRVGYHLLLWGSSQPRDLNPPASPALAGGFFTTSATWEAQVSLGLNKYFTAWGQET